ncbi:centrosomal protein of 135 kDa-like isoform X2 [Haliotis rufescens]|uniref:centrosomal protein of 135 kDa-like isoform X2 n=1 Tax=Haliotis rufescens TaxID=6454 RepID=UPI00201FA4EC|nr:centrosomal protein of 135 kDa-like isoform X2 [Haliotis rufescens]
MAATASAQAQQKFTNVRRRLDQLGYRQSLGIESLPLVEKLFADLIHTTESLKTAKLELGKRQNETKEVDGAVEPYKMDNAKLVRENNEIHLQLIKQKEDMDTVVRELKASLRKLEHENADLKFLNNQYVHKVRQLEKDAREKADRILSLQEKNFHAVVQTPGGRKKTIPFRRQRMEIDLTVPSAESSGFNVPPPDDPYVADLLQVADTRIANLEEEVCTLQDEKDVMDRKIRTFRQQVEGRDEEIERMSRMLDGGRPADVVALETRNRANERMISHLNIQVDFMSNKNRELERKLHDSNYKITDADSKLMKRQSQIRDLEAELHDVDRIAKRIQGDKEKVVKTADREMFEAKETKRMSKELSEMKMRFSSKENENIRLEGLLDRIEEEKRRLSQRCNKMTANEKELVLEIERLKRKNGPVKKGKIPSKLDAFIRSVEEERDYYREQAESLQRLLRGDPPRARSPIRSRPSSRAGSPVREATPSRSDKKSIVQYETIMRVLEEEKDYYKREYEALKLLKRSATPIRSSPTKGIMEEAEISRLTRERDELKGLLDKFERHMAEIQANVKVLTSERDKLNSMYEETRDELMRLRRELVISPKSPKPSLAAQALLRRAENERDDVIADLRRLTTERDSLRERLKIATETSLSDRARLEQRVEDLENTLHTVEAERNEFIVRVNVLKDEIKTLEEQIKDMAFRLTEVTDDASKVRSTASQMKMLAEESEKSLEETQRRLSRREGELQSQEERSVTLEERLAELSRALQIARDDGNQLRNTINAMDREKDSLQLTVDEKTEKQAQLNNELHDRERFISDLKIRVSELEAQLGHANENLNLKDRELKSMRRQLESTGEDLTETSRNKDIALRENRRLQDDLAVMTKENQKLNQELQDALEEREQLKVQVQAYIIEVKRTEDVLSSKEQERSDILEQYRRLSMEAEQYQTTSHQLESEGSNLRLELMTKDSELRRYRDKTDNLEREVQEHLSAQQSYEIQLSNLTRSVATLEESLRQTEEDKQNLLADLTAVREMCSRLEGVKETLQRQLTSSSLDKEQLASVIEDLRQEGDLLKGQVSSERTTAKNLESLLQNNREKEFQFQLTSQERNAEVQMLKDRLSLNESKIQSQSREIASLRTRNVELEGDVERLRRQLTGERFERERAVQEMRRHGLNPPVMISEYSSSLTRVSRSYSPGRARSRSRSRSPSPSRYRSPDTSMLSSSGRRRSPERTSYIGQDDDLLDTTPKSYGHDVL